MEIVYSKHFVVRKKLRGIPDGLAEVVLDKAEGFYRDSKTNHFIAVRRMGFQGSEKDMALTYDKLGNKIVLITLHPLKDRQRENRVESGRWVQL